MSNFQTFVLFPLYLEKTLKLNLQGKKEPLKTFIFTSECVAFMSIGGGGKKRLVDSCELYFFVEPLTSGKSNQGLSRAQISVHRASAKVGPKSGKISAQPHTIVKQICFPNGNVMFLTLFSLSKN